MVQLGHPPLRIDLLMAIDGVSFDACYANRKEVDYGGLRMNFISYHDLVKNKRATTRHRDLDDLENMPRLKARVNTRTLQATSAGDWAFSSKEHHDPRAAHDREVLDDVLPTR